jgi:hypothetical protein
MKLQKDIKRIVIGGALVYGAFTSSAMANDVSIHGFVSQGLLGSTHYNFLGNTEERLSTELREIGVNFQSQVTDNIRVGIQLLSRDVGPYGNNKIEVDWAYGNYEVNDMLNISVGKNKLILGLYSAYQDMDFLTPFAMMPSVIYEKGLRGFLNTTYGLSTGGNFDFNNAGNLDYSLSLGTMDFENDDMEQYLKVLGVEESKSNTLDFAASANILYNTPLPGLKLNATYLKMQNISREKSKKGLFYIDQKADPNWVFLGAHYSRDIIDIMGEWHLRSDILIKSVYINADNPKYGTLPTKADSDGYKQMPTTQMPQEADTTNRGGWYVGANVKPLDWFNVGSYFQMYTDRYDETNGTFGLPIDTDRHTNYNRDLALTTTFKIGSELVIKLEGHNVWGTALLAATANPDYFDGSNPANPVFTNGDVWQYGILKVTYNF